MTSEPASEDVTLFEKLLMAAAVFGVFTGLTLWVLQEHSAEASALWKRATGKVATWLD